MAFRTPHRCPGHIRRRPGENSSRIRLSNVACACSDAAEIPRECARNCTSARPRTFSCRIVSAFAAKVISQPVGQLVNLHADRPPSISLSKTSRAAPALLKASALRSWCSSVAPGSGTNTAGFPAAASSAKDPAPAPAITRSALAKAAGMSSMYGTTWPCIPLSANRFANAAQSAEPVW